MRSSNRCPEFRRRDEDPDVLSAPAIVSVHHGVDDGFPHGLGRIFPILDPCKALDPPADLHVAIDELLGVVYQLVQRAAQVAPVDVADDVDALEAHAGDLSLSDQTLWVFGKKRYPGMGRREIFSLLHQAAQAA